MEHDVVLTDEVDHAGILLLPPFLVIVAHEVDGVGDIADRSVEPYIEHLAVGTLHGHRDTPVEVAAHGTRLQAKVEPRLALAVDVRLPFLMLLENPFLETLLPLVEGEIEMGGLAHHRHAPGDGRAGIDQVGGVEARAAGLALVAVRSLRAAVGALPGHVTVGEELPRLLVVKLHRGLLHEFTFVVQSAEKVGSGAGMRPGGGTAVYVERYAELLERILDYLMITVHYILGGDTLLAGLDGDRHPMLVTAAYEQHLLSLEAEISRIDVGGNIDSGQMADMNRPVGVWQGRRDKCSLEFFHRF